MKSVFKLVRKGLHHGLGKNRTLRNVGGVMLAAVAAKVAIDTYEAIKTRVTEPSAPRPPAEPPLASEAAES